MAKSIHDMAVDYGHRHCGCCNIEDFEAGANAVLTCLEFLLDRTALYKDGSDTTVLYLELKDFMNELKGE